MWEALRPADWLAVYQHRWRDKDWWKQAKDRLQDTLPSVNMAHVKSDRDDCGSIADDATIFLVKKV